MADQLETDDSLAELFVPTYDYSQDEGPYVRRVSPMPVALRGKIETLEIEDGHLFAIAGGRAYRARPETDLDSARERVAAGEDVTLEATVEGFKRPLRLDANALFAGGGTDG